MRAVFMFGLFLLIIACKSEALLEDGRRIKVTKHYTQYGLVLRDSTGNEVPSWWVEKLQKP